MPKTQTKDLDPNHEDYLETLAEAFLDSGGAGTAALTHASEQEQEEFYAFAFQLYESAQYQQACSLFERLCRAKPTEQRYFKALGMARQMAHAYRAAVDAYGIAAILDLEDPEPSVHAAECLLHCGELGRARSAVEGAELQLELHPHAELGKRLRAVRTAIGEYDKEHRSGEPAAPPAEKTD